MPELTRRSLLLSTAAIPLAVAGRGLPPDTVPVYAYDWRTGGWDSYRMTLSVQEAIDDWAWRMPGL